MWCVVYVAYLESGLSNGESHVRASYVERGQHGVGLSLAQIGPQRCRDAGADESKMTITGDFG